MKYCQTYYVHNLEKQKNTFPFYLELFYKKCSTFFFYHQKCDVSTFFSLKQYLLTLLPLSALQAVNSFSECSHPFRKVLTLNALSYLGVYICNTQVSLKLRVLPSNSHKSAHVILAQCYHVFAIISEIREVSQI